MSSSAGNTDQPDAVARLLDYTDARLLDFLHASGILLASQDHRFSRDDILKVARKAYWIGVEDRAENPEAVARVTADFLSSAHSGGSRAR